MPATFKPELKVDARKDGTRAVRIRITKFRKNVYFNLGKYVMPSHWNAKAKPHLKNWITGHPEAPQYNNAIKNALVGLEQISDSLPAATAAGIKEAYEKHLNPEPEAPEVTPLSFWEFAVGYVERLRDKSYHTGRVTECNIESFKVVVGETTPYEELFTERNLNKYIKALKEKGNNLVTIENKVKTIKKAYKYGVKTASLPDLGSPFKAIKLTVPKKKKVRPTAAQIREFTRYEPKNELQTMAKNVAMMQYLLQGARIGEALTLEWSGVHEAYLEYLPQKGALKPKFIPRSNMINALLDQMNKDTRYVLPYIGEDYAELTDKKKYYRKNRITVMVNAGLKEIAQELKMNIPLSSHMMRHAFADAVIATGSNVYVAAALLGHSSPKTTEGYIKDLQLEDVSAVSASIFDNLSGEQ